MIYLLFDNLKDMHLVQEKADIIKPQHLKIEEENGMLLLSLF